jgi:hypothetical protein
VWRQKHYDVTDKNKNVQFEDLNIYYHRESDRTRCDTSDNVCLNLQTDVILPVYNVFLTEVLYFFTSDIEIDILL